MRAKAQEYIAAGEFSIANHDERVFESLRKTIALAAACGYTTIYDNRSRNAGNFIGEVPLSNWPGMTGKNGAGYEYAFDGMKILARPMLPPNHGLNMKPKSSEETLDVR